jgi:hypothetical protein
VRLGWLTLVPVPTFSRLTLREQARNHELASYLEMRAGARQSGNVDERRVPLALLVQGLDPSFEEKAGFAFLSRPPLDHAQLFSEFRNRGGKRRYPRHGFEQVGVGFGRHKLEGGPSLVHYLAGSFYHEPP